VIAVPADSLLAALAHDAEEEAGRILAAAAADAERVRTASTEHLAATRDARVAARAAELARNAERRRGAAAREARAALLAAQWRFVERVLTVVRDALPGALDGPENEAATAQLLDEALAFLPPGQGTVGCSPRAVAAVRALVGAEHGLDVVGRDDIRSGIRLESADGRVVVDNTLDERLAHLTPELAAAMVRLELEHT